MTEISSHWFTWIAPVFPLAAALLYLWHDKLPLWCSRDDVGYVKNIRVSKILVHPIKSCRGTSVQSADYTPQGLINDRKWCISDADTNAVLTARECPTMVLIAPKIELDESSPHAGTLTVSFPDTSGIAPFAVPLSPTTEYLKDWKTIETLSLWDQADIDGYICQSIDASMESPSAILSRYLGRPVLFLYKGPRIRVCDPTASHPKLKADLHFQDGYPILLMSDESLDRMHEVLQANIGSQGISETWKQEKLTIERFRPNICVTGGGPFAEDNWASISIGKNAPPISLVSKCPRCLLPNVDPHTGLKDPAVPYKVLLKFRTKLDPKHKFTPCVGCNAVSHGSGVVRVGDTVVVNKLVE